jgi:hypothetical protein
MPKRQKELENKTFNFGAILIAGGYLRFPWDLAFEVWDFSVSPFSTCRATRPTAC